jgi:predicted regulator of Ras-like GTPase activity (Roadblock/LC7/MglB family)
MHMPHPDEYINCPNCAELINPDAILCRFCQRGLSDKQFRPCPQCGEMIRNEALFCRFCRRELTEAAPSQPPPEEPPGAVGRLAPEKPEEPPAQDAGKIKSIGKFLLDPKDMAKLGDLINHNFPDTKMRILRAGDASELRKMLDDIGSENDVVGSLLAGHDGLLIANTLPDDMEPDSIAVCALGVFMNTQQLAKKLGQEHVYQIVSLTSRGYMVISDFCGGLLVTVCATSEIGKLVPIMRKISLLLAS